MVVSNMWHTVMIHRQKHQVLCISKYTFWWICHMNLNYLGNMWFPNSISVSPFQFDLAQLRSVKGLLKLRLSGLLDRCHPCWIPAFSVEISSDHVDTDTTHTSFYKMTHLLHRSRSSHSIALRLHNLPVLKRLYWVGWIQQLGFLYTRQKKC